MIVKKSSNMSEDDEDPVNRHGKKFSKFGKKMDFFFRTTVKKNSSQNLPKQQIKCDDGVIVEDSSRLNGTEHLIDGNSHPLHNSHTSSNLIEMKKVSEEKINIKNEKRSIIKRKIHQLKRFEHVRSNELEENAMDVVVDVHCENTEKLKDTVTEDGETSLTHSNLMKDDAQAMLNNYGDSMKKQRKRWSKDASVIELPSRNSLSSTTSGKSYSSKFVNDENTVIPVPAPRLNRIINLEEDSDAGIDNEAFESDQDNEQILTIETESGVSNNTKIVIKSVNNIIENSNQFLMDNLQYQKISSYSNMEKPPLHVTDDSTVDETSSFRPPERFSRKITSVSQQSEDSGSSAIRNINSVKNVKIKKINIKKSSRIHKFSDSYETEDSVDGSLPDIQSSRKSIEIIEGEKKIKKHKLKIERESVTDDSSQDFGEEIPSTLEKKLSRKISKSMKKKENIEMKFISITIHKADILQMDYITRHPMVIVHIVEANTGNYIRPKNEKNQSHYLQPLITGAFNFKDNKSMSPHWEEELIFEQDFNMILMNEKNKALILFEIVDLLSFAEASSSYDKFGSENCWYKIAWAFLKPIGNKKIFHMNKQIRLQLYKPKRIIRMKIRHKCEVYNWWKSGNREKYPSTLYVTVSHVEPPKLEPVFYSDLILSDTAEDLPNLSQKITKDGFIESISIPKWSRLAAQSCKIPNDLYFNTEMSENGCFYVNFSNNGIYLACANADEYDHPIVIYKVDEMKIFIKFSGHKNFIYSLDWSANDDFLLSVSSDQTACIWDVKNKLINYVCMLPHPSYVYCGKFNPSLNAQVIATGCYDHVVRIWVKSKTTCELIQELEGHEAFVNSMCFHQKDGILLTADSIGTIIQWSLRKNRKKSHNYYWLITKKIKIREIEGIPINTIVLHPLGSRLLVHSRDNGLRLLDLATGIVLKKYEGLRNTRIQINGRISPCGGLLLCGGEDGKLRIWDIESGKHVAVYQTYPHNSIVTCVDYHPYDHALVYSTIGAPSASVVLRFNKNSTGEKIGLKLITQQDQEHSCTPTSIIGTKQSLSRRRSKDNVLLRESNEFESKYSELSQRSYETRQDFRKKLKIFNENEEQFKTKSANRLTNIIAKIDKILSNSGSRSQYDIEANRFQVSMEQVTRSPASPYIPPLFSNFEDNSSGSKSTELFEIINLNKKYDSKNSKSKSAREEVSYIRNSCEKFDEALLDGAINHREIKKDKNTCENAHEESSEESHGTYTIEINDDKYDKILIESDSSIKSHVTFVVEHEKSQLPIPKPRNRINLLQQ